jgi:hypothetical protein
MGTIFIWYTDGSRTREGWGARAYVHSLGRRLSICIGKYVTVFQAEIYASYVLMKFRLTLHKRNTLVFALRVKQL